MSQHCDDPRSVVRIAIALAALKHIPRDRSIASYLLDLQSLFPIATGHIESRDWRTYALELEKQLATLKVQRDADQELLSKIPTNTSTSDGPPPKKKSKKNPAKDQHDPEWSWDQSRANWSRFLSSQYPSSPSLIAAYATLRGALASPNTDLLSYASRLTGAILRTFDTTYLFLFSPQNVSSDMHSQTAIGTPPQLKPEHMDGPRIALASPLLMYALRTALPALVRTVNDSTKSKRPRLRQHATILTVTDAHAHVDRVLDHLIERVLLPLLRALVPLCSARLAPLVSTSLKKGKEKVRRVVGKGRDKDKDKGTNSASVDLPKKDDVRTDVFALICVSLEALDALPPLVCPPHSGVTGGGSGRDSHIVSGIRDRLGLETIRELETLYAIPPPNSLQLSSRQPPATPSDLSLSLPTPPDTQLSAQPQSQVQSRSQQHGIAESRTKRLERLAGTRAERVRALTTRDAGWLLASTLNLCVTPAPTPLAAVVHSRGAPRDASAGRTEPSGGLLREALLDRVGKMVRSVSAPLCVGPVTDQQQPGNPSDTLGDPAITDASALDSKFAIDPVCQNMLLAICERALSYFVSA